MVPSHSRFLADWDRPIDSSGDRRRAATIEDRYPPTTVIGRAEEPESLPAKVVGGPVKIDRIALVLPVFSVASVAVGGDYPARFGAHPDGGDHFAMA